MCHAITYVYKNAKGTVHFVDNNATLPVLTRKGIKFVSWGRRFMEPGVLPQASWALLDDIKTDRWAKHNPLPVIIPATRFMYRDLYDHARWYTLMQGQALQGLLARVRNEKRLYIVTKQPHEVGRSAAGQWPRIIIRPK